MKLTINKRPENERSVVASRLETGCQVFHNGVPVQLLYLIGNNKRQETWRVRPLFVEAPDRDERFCGSDTISYLHTRRAPRWSYAA
jgi:hypothetical protein